MRPIVAGTALSVTKGVENESDREEGRKKDGNEGLKWSSPRASSRGERKKGGRII